MSTLLVVVVAVAYWVGWATQMLYLWSSSGPFWARFYGQQGLSPREVTLRTRLCWPVIVLSPVVIVCDVVRIHNTYDALSVLIDVGIMVSAWRHRNDDDWWKRKRKQAAEKIQAVAGRLVVVPIPAGA